MKTIFPVYFGVVLLIKKYNIMFLYLGPGLGGGIIAVITGIFLTLFAFLVAIFWLPLKRFFGFIKSKINKG